MYYKINLSYFIFECVCVILKARGVVARGLVSDVAPLHLSPVARQESEDVNDKEDLQVLFIYLFI